MTELSPYELTLLRRLADGATLAAIAVQDHLSRSAIHMAAKRMREHIGARTNPHAVRLADLAGLLPLPAGPIRREDDPYDPPALPGDPFRYALGAGLPRAGYPYRTAPTSGDPA